MAFIGTISTFSEADESFEDYADQVDAYLAANKIEDAQKTNVFLLIVGATTFKLLKNLCSPDHPKDKTYKEICDVLKGHYSPAPITIAERFKFWTAMLRK